jgi:signal transduction histidine kinase
MVRKECSDVCGVPNGAGEAKRPVVLVVDDDEAMLDSCQEVLCREGFDVFPFNRGAAALEYMQKETVDVVIVDLKMPGMSGEEFLRTAIERDPQLVAVVVTGYPELSSAVEVMKAGAYDFLPKPFGADELRIITRRAVEKRKLALAVAKGEREKRRMHDNFVAMVTHQLKSPAAVIKECLDTALATKECQSPRCRDLVERAAARTQSLLALMDDWLILARAESGTLMASTQPLDLCAVVKEAAEEAQRIPHHNNVGLQLVCKQPSLHLRGDAKALREMVVNLIDNALRYTPDGGRAMVSVHAQGQEAVVSVSDTGPGISPEEKEIIFEPFYRGESAKEKPGTGLGLAIVKRIAEAHGGRVCVESERGRGTTFTVHLRGVENAS